MKTFSQFVIEANENSQNDAQLKEHLRQLLNASSLGGTMTAFRGLKPSFSKDPVTGDIEATVNTPIRGKRVAIYAIWRKKEQEISVKIDCPGKTNYVKWQEFNSFADATKWLRIEGEKYINSQLNIIKESVKNTPLTDDDKEQLIRLVRRLPYFHGRPVAIHTIADHKNVPEKYVAMLNVYVNKTKVEIQAACATNGYREVEISAGGDLATMVDRNGDYAKLFDWLKTKGDAFIKKQTNKRGVNEAVEAAKFTDEPDYFREAAAIALNEISSYKKMKHVPDVGLAANCRKMINSLKNFKFSDDDISNAFHVFSQEATIGDPLPYIDEPDTYEWRKFSLTNEQLATLFTKKAGFKKTIEAPLAKAFKEVDFSKKLKAAGKKDWELEQARWEHIDKYLSELYKEYPPTDKESGSAWVSRLKKEGHLE
jgi:hypothetical protein